MKLLRAKIALLIIRFLLQYVEGYHIHKNPPKKETILENNK